VCVMYSAPELLLPGRYQIAAWIPPLHADLEVVYTMMVNGNEFPNDAGDLAVALNQSAYADGQWVELGTWTTPRIYEKPLQLSLRMEIKSGSVGEAAFDAIAFIRLNETEQESP
jgi:hypothetical protein